MTVSFPGYGWRDDDESIAGLLSVPYTFTVRPTPLPADLRAIWRISLLLLMLNRACRGGRSSLLRLHVLNWGIRTDAGRRHLFAALDGSRRPQDLLVRLEPSLNRAIDFALGEGLVTLRQGDRIEIAARGTDTLREVDALPDLFRNEKEFLSHVGLRITETWVQAVMRPPALSL